MSDMPSDVSAIKLSEREIDTRYSVNMRACTNTYIGTEMFMQMRRIIVPTIEDTTYVLQ